MLSQSGYWGRRTAWYPLLQDKSSSGTKFTSIYRTTTNPVQVCTSTVSNREILQRFDNNSENYSDPVQLIQAFILLTAFDHMSIFFHMDTRSVTTR